MTESYHTIVLGLGAMGAATLYQCAKLAQLESNSPQILGIDQYSPPHTFGSSHGESRISRLAICEGEEYVPLVQRSHELWREIASATHHEFGTLYTPTGGIFIGPAATHSDFHGAASGLVEQTRQCAEQYHIPHRNLTASQLRQEFPQFVINSDDVGYYEPSIGALAADNCIRAQLQLAERYGATIHTQEKVLGFTKVAGERIKVTTQYREYLTQHLIIAAGAWAPGLLGIEYAPLLTIYRQVLYWFAVEPAARAQYALGKIPIFIRDFGNDTITYGFPLLNTPDSMQGSIKFGTIHTDKTAATPEAVVRQVRAEEIQTFYATYVKDRFVGITQDCVNTVTCLYTVTPNWRFVIDYLPEFSTNAIAISACSGHGFKHSAAIGEAVAQRVFTGKSAIDVFQLFPRSAIT